MSEFNPHTNYLGQNMFYMYVLKSKKDKEFYVGYTNNLKRRIKDHNAGLVFSTRGRKPLSLIYYEGYRAEVDARNRERNLKLRSRAFTQLKKRIEESSK